MQGAPFCDFRFQRIGGGESANEVTSGEEP